MNSRFARLLIAVVFSALGIIYSFATPIFEKNDEESHAWFAWHLANGGELPVQVPGRPESPLQREGSQPPLYYWIAAAVMSRFDLSDFWIQQQPNQSPSFSPYAPSNKNLLLITPQKRAFNYEKTTLATVALRLLGIIPGLLTIWFVYPIAWAVTRNEGVALLAMGLTAFNPMLLQVMTALGNDGLVIALATLSLHVILRAVTADTNENGFSPARVAVIGILIGLASLSKVSGLLLLPVAAAAIVGRALIQPVHTLFGRRAVAMIAQGMGVLGLWALIAGWWYWRNLQLYGDFTGTSIMAQMMTPRAISLAEALSEWQGFKMSYIAMFGQFAAPADDIVYIGFDILLIASGIGLLIGLARTLRQAWQPGNAAQHLRVLGIGLLALHVALLLVSVLRWTMMTPASHGRLIFPGIAAVSTLMGIGVTQIGALTTQLMRMRRSPLPAGVSVTALIVIVPLLVVAAVAPFRYIWPAYEPPLISEMPAGLIPVHQRMGNLAEVLGYSMQPQYARPGDRVRVTVAMRALRAERDNYSLAVKLYGRDTALLNRFDTFTGKGLWPSMLWRPGDIFLDEVELHVPVTATAPTVLRAQFELYNAGSGDIQQSVDAAGRPGAPLYDGTTLLPREHATPSARTAIARFGALAALSHFKTSSDTLTPGGSLTLTLEWITLGQTDRDLTIFAQLINEAGEISAQHDKQPLDGQFPTTRWQAETQFADQHIFQLPQDLAPGVYRIALGFYDAMTGQRLPVIAGAAEQAGPAWQVAIDHVLLGSFTAQ